MEKAFSSDAIFHISENSCELLVQLDIDISTVFSTTHHFFKCKWGQKVFCFFVSFEAVNI